MYCSEKYSHIKYLFIHSQNLTTSNVEMQPTPSTSYPKNPEYKNPLNASSATSGAHWTPAPPPPQWRAWRRNHSRREEKTRSRKTGSVDVELQFDPKLGRSSPRKLPGRYETITPSAAVTSGIDPGVKESRRVWEHLDSSQSFQKSEFVILFLGRLVLRFTVVSGHAHIWQISRLTLEKKKHDMFDCCCFTHDVNVRRSYLNKIDALYIIFWDFKMQIQ